jgi:hypothetical protein
MNRAKHLAIDWHLNGDKLKVIHTKLESALCAYTALSHGYRRLPKA